MKGTKRMRFSGGRLFCFVFVICIIFSAAVLGKITIVVNSGPFKAVEASEKVPCLSELAQVTYTN